MYGTLAHLKREHPDLKLFNSATRKFDGKKFKVGDAIEFKGHMCKAVDDFTKLGGFKIIAFDHYNHPQFGFVKRAICYFTEFSFNNLNDIDLLRIVYKRKILIEKNKMGN